MNDAVLIALIGAFATIAAGIPAVLIERARRENTADHGIVRSRLGKLFEAIGEVSEQIESVDDKLSEHLKDHDTDKQS